MLSIKKHQQFVNNIVLIFVIGLLASCAGSSDEAEFVNRAKEHLKIQELNAAALELKNALLSNAQNAEARYLLSKIKLETGELSTAEKEVRRALDAGWDEAESKILLAEVLIRQGKYKILLEEIAAKDNYSKMALAEILGLRAAAYGSLGQWDDAVEEVNADESLPQDANWLLLAKAHIAIHDGDLSAVKEILVKALILYPDNQDLWLLSGGLSADEKDYDGAISALQKVIDLDPPKIMTAWGRQGHTGLFRIFFKQNEMAKAEAALSPVLNTYPSDPEANYLGALLAFVEQNYDLAEERLLIVLRANPLNREGLLLYGRLNYIQKDYQQAAYYLERATSSQPDNVLAQSLLGETYLMLGEYDEAEKKLRFASSKSADNVKLLALIGEVKMRSNDAQAGVVELEKAAAAHPTDKLVSSRLADTYMASGHISSAIQTLEGALANSNQDLQFKSMLLLSYMQAAEYKKALKLANEIVEQAPDQPLAYNLKGLVFEGQKDFAAARENYNKALTIQANNSMAQLSLARLDLAKGGKDQAEKRYRKVLETDPDNSAVLVALAKIQASEGQAEKAIELLEKARQANPKELDARLILSNYFLNRNDAEKSLLLAEEALNAVPQSPTAMLALARAQMMTDKSAALTTLNNLVQYAPTYAEAYFYLAQAQSISGDIAKVKKSLQRAVKLKPDYLQAQLALARVDLDAGKVDAVLASVEQIQQQDKENAAVYLLQGDAWLAKKNFQAAMSAYRQAVKYSSESGAVIRISKLYQKQGKPDKAIKELLNWLKNNEDNFAARFYLALSYLSNGENEKAYIEYTRINKQYPDNAAVMNDLAWLKFEKGETDALQMAEQAYKLAPDNAGIQDTYGWILFKTGRVETALSTLFQASDKWPANMDIRYHYLAALAQTGEKQQAKKGLDVILNSGQSFAEREQAKALRDSL